MNIYITHRKATRYKQCLACIPLLQFWRESCSWKVIISAIISALPLLRHLGAYQTPVERESREQSILLTPGRSCTPLATAPRTVMLRVDRRAPNAFLQPSVMCPLEGIFVQRYCRNSLLSSTVPLFCATEGPAGLTHVEIKVLGVSAEDWTALQCLGKT